MNIHISDANFNSQFSQKLNGHNIHSPSFRCGQDAALKIKIGLACIIPIPSSNRNEWNDAQGPTNKFEN